MNIFKKIVHSKPNPVQSNPAPEHDQTIGTLKSLFNDYKQRIDVHGIHESDEYLYKIVPLFYKIFLSTPGHEISEKFPDVFSFCKFISSLMVKEIKRRATNQKTEEASSAIVHFLQPNLPDSGLTTPEEESKGWQLLSVIGILSRGPVPFLDCMISTGLPSTLVKCLYIFFDLPDIEHEEHQQFTSTLPQSIQQQIRPDLSLEYQTLSQDGNSNVRCNRCDQFALQRRSILMDLFKQIIQRICFYPATTEELVRKEDLRLLFGAVASWCPSHNSGWRKIAADVLQTIAHNGLSQNTIQHIYHKKLISQCLKNISKGGLNSMEIVDIFVTLFHLLRESSDINQMLLDDFRNSQGYVVIEDFLIKLEKEISNETEQDSIQSLIILIGKLTTCGYVELKPKQSIVSDVIYDMGEFELPLPLNKNESIRNYHAFNVLQTVFMHAHTDFLSLKILEGIKNIYKQDPANYFILEPQNTFQVFSEKIHERSPIVQEQFFNLISCVVENLSYVPIKEISSTAVIMRTCNQAVTQILLIRLFIRLLDFHKIFKDVLRDLGILELSVNLLHTYVYNLKQEQQANTKVTEQSDTTSVTAASDEAIDDKTEELGMLLLDLLMILIQGVPKNIELFRKIGGSGCIYSLIGLNSQFPLFDTPDHAHNSNANNINRTGSSSSENSSNFCRSQIKALQFLKALAISSGSEEDMTSFISLIRSVPSNNIGLKCWVLHTLFNVLRESHRCRIVFRKVHSFVLLIQEIVHLEGRLSIKELSHESETSSSNISLLFEYIELIIAILSISLRKEPSNVRYFVYNVGYASFSESLRNLGCFGSDVDLIPIDTSAIGMFNQHTSDEELSQITRLLDELFIQSVSYQSLVTSLTGTEPNSNTMKHVLYISIVFKFIFDHSIESISDTILNGKSQFIAFLQRFKDSKHHSSQDIQIKETRQIRSNFIIHPEAIIALLHLIPAVKSEHLPTSVQLHVQGYMLERIRKLLEKERNMQIMSSSSHNMEMLQELLSCFRVCIMDPDHPLNEIVIALFERLAANRICPKNLRDFLRLSDPLCCRGNLRENSRDGENGSENGGPLSLDKIKSLISITSQQQQLYRDEDKVLIPVSVYQDHWLTSGGDSHRNKEAQCYAEMKAVRVPAFVEMDMRREGFACIYLPSIAPQNVSSGVASSVGLVSPLDTNTVGGIGLGERVFPPTGGFSFSTWFCIEKFSSNNNSNIHSQSFHPVRLLTLLRNVFGGYESVVCLSVSLINMGISTSIVISTNEETMSSRKEPTCDTQTDTLIDFPCDNIIKERSWVNLVLTFHRSGMLKHSSCSCYLNGQFIGCKKLNYISASISVTSLANSSSTNNTSSGGSSSLVTSVHAFVGTLPQQHKISSLCWRQGPIHLIEEPLSAQNISHIMRLGPNYFGNFQNPVLDHGVSTGSLVAEEKVVFSLYASNISFFTLPKINKIYNEIDANFIARQLHLHPKEKSSPIRVLHNAACHLSGTARTLGGVLVGCEGVRCFSPAPLAYVLDCVGGANVLLGILAMATDPEYLYGAIKFLCTTLSDNLSLVKDLERNQGYKLINFLLKKKRHLLSTRSLGLLIGLCGSSEQQEFTSATLNRCPDNLRFFQSTLVSTSQNQNNNSNSVMHVTDISQLNRVFNRRLFEEIVCDLELWARPTVPLDNAENNDELMVYVLNHFCEFFEKCIETRNLGLNSSWKGKTDDNELMERMKIMDRDARICGSRANSILNFLLNLKLLDKLTFVIMEYKIDASNISLCDKLSKLIKILLINSKRPEDFRVLGQFMIWTLSDLGTTEADVNLEENRDHKSMELGQSIYKITIRNLCFRVLIDLLDISNDSSNSADSDRINTKFSDLIITQLGYDWLLLFLKPEVHSSSVLLAMRCLFNLIIIPGNIAKFRDGSSCSSWLSGTEVVLKKRHGLLLMENAKDQVVSLREINLDSCHQPGFVMLQSLLPHHCQIPDLYFILIAILLGNRIKTIPDNLTFEFETVCNFLFGGTIGDATSAKSPDEVQSPGSGTKSGLFTKLGANSSNSRLFTGLLSRMDSSSKHNDDAHHTSNSVTTVKPADMCPEVASILMTMMRVMMTQNCNINCQNDKHNWLKDYPITLLRFFVYLYHSNTEFQHIAMQSDFIIGLTKAMYPMLETCLANSSTAQVRSSLHTNNKRVASHFVSISNIEFQNNESCRHSDSAITSNVEDKSPDKRNSAVNEEAVVITASLINSQPVRKLIMDFFKTIVLDCFTLFPQQHLYNQQVYRSSSITSSPHIIDIILETDLENSIPEHIKQFHTVFINSLLEHLLAVDVLSGENLPLPSGGSYTNIPNNIFYLMSRVVDKVWQGGYVDNPKSVFVFLYRLLVQSKKKEFAADSLYRSHNRLVLFVLWKACNHSSMNNRFSHLISVLQKFMRPEDPDSYHHHLFHTSNNDPEFFVCLTQILIQLLDGKSVVGCSTWYVTSSIVADDVAKSTGRRGQNYQDRLVEMIDVIWKELYSSKKPLLEDQFKCQLSPNLSLVSSGIEPTSARVWTLYLEAETGAGPSPGIFNPALSSSMNWGRISSSTTATTTVNQSSGGYPVGGGGGSSSVSGSGGNSSGVSSSSGGGGGLQHQISVKLNKFSRSSVLGRFSNSSVSSSTQNSPAGITGSSSACLFPSSIEAAKQMISISLEDSKLWIPPHISVVKELMEFYKNEFIKKETFMLHYLESNWKKVEVELTRERGLWGPLSRNPLDKWMLDSSEGPCRMRKKMIPNQLFYKHYPYRAPVQLNSSGDGNYAESLALFKKFRAASSRDSKIFYERSMSRVILQDTSTLKQSSHPDNGGVTKSEPAEKTNDEHQNIDDIEVSLRNTQSLIGLRKLKRGNAAGSTNSENNSLDGDQLSTSGGNNSHRVTSSKSNEENASQDDDDEILQMEGINQRGGKYTSIDEENEENDSKKSIDESSQQRSNEENQETVQQQQQQQPPPNLIGPPPQPMWDQQTAIEHLIGSDERIHFMFRCARIQGLEILEGLLLFGQSYFYIIDGFTLLKTREIVEIDNIPIDVHEPIVPRSNSCPSSSANCSNKDCEGHISQRKKMNEKFSFEEIREIHRRRYLLQPIAIEVFLADGRNFLLAFPKKMQNKIYTKFMQVSPYLIVNAQMSISGQKQNSKIESSGPGILSSLMGEKSVTQRWERGEISNFQYLMHLNTLAGRSYNDLMQYPVFPWILADYSSDTLDLTKPSTFRQLHKPMGAQSDSRMRDFQKRYREWDDPSGETPPYHYGTHYSSAMIVAFYMVRMEPFTQHFLKLQGGHFDLADRMFHSIKDTWDSASQHNMADIKELIPEFFYLPNFLSNSNNFDLGVKQNGIGLGDVILPPWAKGDSKEFIRAHREALECDFVSAHLHEWIDLIFGFKQVGDPAVEAVNVFHHLFYEGNADIYSIDDPLKRSAVVGFINNFGQIPKQLFRKPHPSKRLALPISIMPPIMSSMASSVDAVGLQLEYQGPIASSAIAERLFYHNLDNLEPCLQPIKELKNAVGQIVQIDPSMNLGGGISGSGGHGSGSSASGPAVSFGNTPSDVGTGSNTQATLSVTNNNLLAVEQNKCLIPPSYSRYVAWGFSDGSLRLGSYESDKLIRVYEMPDPHGDILCVACPNEKCLITGGVSTVVRVWSMVYLLDSSSKNQSSSGNSSSGMSSHTAQLAPTLKLQANLYGHREPVTCLTVASQYNILVSGSRDRTCIIWDLARLCFLRQLDGHAGPVAAVCISEVSGRIASCAGTHLHLWDLVDGQELARVNTATGRSKQILTVTMSTMLDWDPGNVVITGGTDGVVRMWSLEYVQVPDHTLLEQQQQHQQSNPHGHSPANLAALMRDSCSKLDISVTTTNQQNSVTSPTSGVADNSCSSVVEFTETEEDEEAMLSQAQEKIVEKDDKNNDETAKTAPKNNEEIATLTRSKSANVENQVAKSPNDNLDDDYVVIASSEIDQITSDLANSKKKSSILKSFSQPHLKHNPRKLRKGFQWQRQLIFRSKLTMHTAYERADNATPSPITAVAISRDHRTVLVGDHKGRLWHWAVPQEPGRNIADHWIRDENAETCTKCSVKFSITERRHHCRNCGFVFCNKCSKNEIEIHRLRIFTAVRVCQNCYTTLHTIQQYNNNTVTTNDDSIDPGNNSSNTTSQNTTSNHSAIS